MYWSHVTVCDCFRGPSSCTGVMSQFVIASEALVVVLESTRADIEKALVEICDVKIKLDFVAIPDSQDWGTADALRHIRDRIKVQCKQFL